MSTRSFAALLGAALFAGAALGFVPTFLVPNADIHPLSMDTPHDQLFGLFPVNAFDNVVHAALGAWGLFASRTGQRARRYARAMAAIFLVLMLGGFVPAAGDLLPLYGNDIWLHGLMSVAAAYFGWVHRSPTA